MRAFVDGSGESGHLAAGISKDVFKVKLPVLWFGLILLQDTNELLSPYLGICFSQALVCIGAPDFTDSPLTSCSPNGGDGNIIQNAVSRPSLHLLGKEDRFIDRVQRFTSSFDPLYATTVYHNEGHKVPSKSTGVYPSVCEWLEKVIGH